MSRRTQLTDLPSDRVQCVPREALALDRRPRAQSAFVDRVEVQLATLVSDLNLLITLQFQDFQRASGENDSAPHLPSAQFSIIFCNLNRFEQSQNTSEHSCNRTALNASFTESCNPNLMRTPLLFKETKTPRRGQQQNQLKNLLLRRERLKETNNLNDTHYVESGLRLSTCTHPCKILQ